MSKRNKNKKNKKTTKNNFIINEFIFKKRKCYNKDNLISNELFKYDMNYKTKISNNPNEYYYENLKRAQEIQKKIKKEEKLNIITTNKITNYKKIIIKENDKKIINDLKIFNNNNINFDNSKRKIIINKKNSRNKIIQKNLNDYFK
jgi:hypothetical protein